MLLLLSLFCVPLAGAEDALSWADCLREASKNNPDIMVAREGVVRQEATRSMTGSSRWPQVSAEMGASSAQSSRTGAGNAFNYGLSGSQLVFDGGETSNSVKASVEDVKAAQEGYRFTSAAVRYRLRQAYINLLKEQELLALTADIRNIRQRSLDMIRLRYQSGIEHRGALLTAQANVSQALFEIDRAVRGLGAAQAALLKELGRAGHVPVKVKGSLEVQGAEIPKPDLDALAASHPSFKKARAQKRSAEFALKADHGDFWPAVSATGGVSRSDARWLPEDRGTSAGVRVSLPLLEGGSRAAKLAGARSSYRESEQQERSIRDGIMLSLEQAWNGFKDAAENVKVRKEFLAAAEERARIVEQQYSVGFASFDDWTIIEDGRISSRKAFLDAQANALLAQAAWVLAKGETLEYEE